MVLLYKLWLSMVLASHGLGVAYRSVLHLCRSKYIASDVVHVAVEGLGVFIKLI